MHVLCAFLDWRPGFADDPNGTEGTGIGCCDARNLLHGSKRIGQCCMWRLIFHMIVGNKFILLLESWRGTANRESSHLLAIVVCPDAVDMPVAASCAPHHVYLTGIKYRWNRFCHTLQHTCAFFRKTWQIRKFQRAILRVNKRSDIAVFQKPQIQLALLCLCENSLMNPGGHVKRRQYAFLSRRNQNAFHADAPCNRGCMHAADHKVHPLAFQGGNPFCNFIGAHVIPEGLHRDRTI